VRILLLQLTSFCCYKIFLVAFKKCFHLNSMKKTQSIHIYANVISHHSPVTDVCSSFPCMNGGKCEATSVSSYICRCADRFHGQWCEIDRDPCLKMPCLNNGRPSWYLCAQREMGCLFSINIIYTVVFNCTKANALTNAQSITKFLTVQRCFDSSDCEVANHLCTVDIQVLRVIKNDFQWVLKF